MTAAVDPALAEALAAARPMLWLHRPTPDTTGVAPGLEGVVAARDRFRRFAPLLARLFPETAPSGGTIESPLVPVPRLQAALALEPRDGRLWIKADHSLPVAGSIKARGGIHEVLEFAEGLAWRDGLLRPGADYAGLAEPPARRHFARYTVSVGSTGNLGLSIGVMASALGFRTVVHMSSDAKAWKKERLRRLGVDVVEHAGDYAAAVACGRDQAAGDPLSHFVDDERSPSLLLGYAAAALHLQAQLQAAEVCVGARNPLFVYLPCGVGGAPAGIAYGLGLLYGPHVHCFFVEPTRSPCFLLQMAAGDSEVSVYDVGLDNRTEADGLAVPRASALAAGLMRDRLAGVCTVDDETLFRLVYELQRHAGMAVEPSAAAGLAGVTAVCRTQAGREYLEARGLAGAMDRATHIAWTTGGLFVPAAEMQGFVARGAALAAASSTVGQHRRAAISGSSGALG